MSIIYSIEGINLVNKITYIAGLADAVYASAFRQTLKKRS